MNELISNIWSVYLDTAFWLLIGLLAAGLVKAFIPADAMQRWLGGRGFSAVGKVALFGAPLPLCSCGVLPAALGLRRAGASKEATVSFLISTPETSIDSVAVTYALMGPVMAVYRPLAALFSAIVTGMAASLTDDEPAVQSRSAIQSSCCSNKPAASCCDSPAEATTGCCAEPVESASNSRLASAIRFAGAELLDDISHWLALGIVIAGVMMTVIPPGWLAQWGQGLPAMLVMLAVGIPMYICASASTPVAAGLLLSGAPPGAVLVFLLVGPATNIAGLMLVRQELGSRTTLIYLLGIAISSVFMGLLLEWLLLSYSLTIDTQIGEAHQLLPSYLSLFSALLLLLLVVPNIRNRLMPFFLAEKLS